MNDDDAYSGYISKEDRLVNINDFVSFSLLPRENNPRSFCVLYKAQRYNKWFVVKALKEQYRDNPQYQEFLKKEFFIMSNLEHNNIVKVFSFENNKDVGFCIVMEFIDGVTLNEFLKKDMPYNIKQKILKELLSALSYIHSKQIIHRDIKPSNIIITFNGNNLKLIDFGFSDSDEFAILKQPAGTKIYAAPEQKIEGGKIDNRTDIYPLGFIIHKIFQGKKYLSIIKKCQQENKEDRYNNVEEIIEEINKRNKNKFVYLCICLFVVIVAVMIVFYFNRNNRPISSDTTKGYNGLKSEKQTININSNEIVKEKDNSNNISSQSTTTKAPNYNINKEIAKEIINNMVYVSGGSFNIGATEEQGDDFYSWEKPVHKVTLSSFYISKYEVTQKQWKAIMGDNPSKNVGDNLPVENITFEQIQEFIKRLNQLTGKHFSLPTDAQWEFAARGGNKSKRYKFSGSNNVNDVSWNENNSRKTTHQIGTKGPNELGLYDMSGNVWELCNDFETPYSNSPQTNPKGMSSGSRHVFRGGSFSCPDNSQRVACKFFLYTQNSSRDIGFRLVCQ